MVVRLGGTVVVIEHDERMREAIERSLDAAALGSAACTSADALLERGVDDDSACLIADLSLPGMQSDLMPCDSINQDLYAILTP